MPLTIIKSEITLQVMNEQARGHEFGDFRSYLALPSVFGNN